MSQWTEEQKHVLRSSIGWWSGWLIGAWEEPLTDEQATALATESIEDYIENCDPPEPHPKPFYCGGGMTDPNSHHEPHPYYDGRQCCGNPLMGAWYS